MVAVPLVPRRRTGSRQPERAFAQWREFFEHQLCAGTHIFHEFDIVRLGGLLLFHRRLEVRRASQFGEVFQYRANLAAAQGYKKLAPERENEASVIREQQRVRGAQASGACRR